MRFRPSVYYTTLDLACSMTRTRKYEHVIWEKGEVVVSSSFIFVFALSRFGGPDYLGA